MKKVAKLNLQGLKQIKNYFNDNASEASNKILDLITELENSEVEIDEKMLYEEVKKLFETEEMPAELVEELEETIEENVEEAVADSIAKMNKGNKQPVANNVNKKEVKNAIAKVVLNSRTKEEVQRNLKEYEVKNGITFTSGDFTNPVVDYDISNKWIDDADELFAAFTQTQITKFFYTTQDWDDEYASAALWVKGTETEKAIQELTVDPKTLTTAYVYKRQRYAQEDLDDIMDAGNLGQFLDWTTWELRRHVVDMIVAAVLGTKSLSNIEGLNASNAAFTTAIGGGDALATYFSFVNVENMRNMVDKVLAKGDKWLIMTQADFTRLAGHILASGGTTMYYTKEELASQLGVDKIYISNLIDEGKVACMVPSEYWVKMKNTLNVAYPQYEYNAQNLQYEINLAGAFHGILSSAYIYNDYE